jgi:hypothetical protein
MFASSIWPRADDRAAVSTIAGAMMHALFLTRCPGAANFRNLTCRGQWAFHCALFVARSGSIAVRCQSVPLSKQCHSPSQCQPVSAESSDGGKVIAVPRYQCDR